MANHKDAIKRIRQTEKRRLHNRYYAKNMRNEIKKFRALTSKSEAEGQLSKLYSVIDKVAKEQSRQPEVEADEVHGKIGIIGSFIHTCWCLFYFVEEAFLLEVSQKTLSLPLQTTTHHEQKEIHQGMGQGRQAS